MTRRCPRCRETKALGEFARNRSAKSGYGSYCKPCHNSVVTENRQKNHGGNRSFWLTRRYRVDSAQVAWMMLRQGGVCALCGTGKPEHVDHDHGTKRIRGYSASIATEGSGSSATTSSLWAGQSTIWRVSYLDE